MLRGLTRAPLTPLLLVAAIVLGAALGHVAPGAGERLGEGVDLTLYALIGLLFFGLRVDALLVAARNLRFLAVAVALNFAVIPLIGYAIASLFLSSEPLMIVGLIIYFMSPCTDWFLGFTRLAGGHVALGAALIPINMTLQLLLYPLYLHLFAGHGVDLEPAMIGDTLLHWFLLPLVIALALRYLLARGMSGARFERLLARLDQMTPWVIALLVLQIFAAHIATILAHGEVFGWLLLAVFVFFLVTFVIGEGVSRWLRLSYPEHALLTMTTAARNAPMMLAVTLTVLPDQPLIYAALIIGMLVEFPHLTTLQRLMLAQRPRGGASRAEPDGRGVTHAKR